MPLSRESYTFLVSLVRHEGRDTHPHGERFAWTDDATPRTSAPVRFTFRPYHELFKLPYTAEVYRQAR